MVHQHFMLADNLTVVENVVIGAEPVRGAVRYATGVRALAAIATCTQLSGLRAPPDELVADLGVGQRQRVEMLKVLYRGAGIMILDEPTAVLVPQEVDELFDEPPAPRPPRAHHRVHLPQARRGTAGRRPITVIRAGPRWPTDPTTCRR